jgi:D-methionine transport system substrate-binding protein
VLAKEGLRIEVVTFSDYILPDLALASGDLDANLYQHVPFMEQFNRDHGTRFVAVTSVHLAPMALYPGRSKSIEALPNGALIGVPNDPVNLGRSLLLMQSASLLTVDPKVGAAASLHDITGNPHHLQFRELEAAQLPRSLPDVDAAIVNGNYALDSGLNPLRDGLIREGKDSRYVNVLSVNKGMENDARVRALAHALTGPETRRFIEEHYRGAVFPAF